MKKVCIVNAVVLEVKDPQTGEVEDTFNPGDRVMRTTVAYAEKLVASREWRYCSKSKLKSFLNKQGKLMRNMRSLEQIQNISGHTYNEKRLNGKVIVEVDTFKSEANPRFKVIDTGFPLITTIKHWNGRVQIVENFTNPTGNHRERVVNRWNKTRENWMDMEIVTKKVRIPVSPLNLTPQEKRKKDYKPTPTQLVGTGKKILVVAY